MMDISQDAYSHRKLQGPIEATTFELLIHHKDS